jgi:hypothetical protein
MITPPNKTRSAKKTNIVNLPPRSFTCTYGGFNAFFFLIQKNLLLTIDNDITDDNQRNSCIFNKKERNSHLKCIMLKTEFLTFKENNGISAFKI